MPASLRLEDFSDHDLLYALERVEDEEGNATAQEIAEGIGIDHEHPTQCVGIRLGWLKRMGIVDRKEEKHVGLWHLTDKGYALIHPNRLSPAAQKALDLLDEGQRLLVTEAVASQMRRTSREGVHLSRRAWKHHVGGWRDASIAPKRKTA